MEQEATILRQEKEIENLIYDLSRRLGFYVCRDSPEMPKTILDKVLITQEMTLARLSCIKNLSSAEIAKRISKEKK